MAIRLKQSHFIDEFNRQVLLHGVNLSGSSKVPFAPDGSTYIRKGFFDHSHVSFVGRPFPLGQADEHLGRLREWGFNFLRLLVTWEAIEHAGPGKYDQEYLDYLHEVVKKAAAHGFNLVIDPHQDVWSRFTGGDGAPGWTLEAVGFDPTHFAETGAAIVHATHGDPFPKMIWPTNASKLACATMFTLFFAGNDFAPRTLVEGEPVQDFLQRHYLQAVQQIAERLKDEPNVIGYNTMNEPSPGFIGWKDITSSGGLLTLGDAPTPFQSMLLGEGEAVEVPEWVLGVASFKKVGSHLINPGHQRAWREGRECIWRENGVWDFDSHGNPHLNQPEYFASVKGKPVHFSDDYYRPFANRFAKSIREVHPQALIFLETEYDTPITQWNDQDATGIVYAPHWYDDYLLAKKEYTPFVGVDRYKYRVVFTPPAIRRSFRRQLAKIQGPAIETLGNVPTMLGEIGIPYDIHHKQAYRSGCFKIHVKALQRTMRAVEDNLLSYTLWNYTPDNTNLHGDLWNDEDFSIFSYDQQTDPRDIYSGGRALEAVIRPFPIATAGELLDAHFDPTRHRFRMRFRHDPSISHPTEIFLPNYHYPRGCSVRVSDGHYEIKRAQQRLLYWPGPELMVHKITLKP